MGETNSLEHYSVVGTVIGYSGREENKVIYYVTGTITCFTKINTFSIQSSPMNYIIFQTSPPRDYDSVDEEVR